jgi:outer membrane protein OmpA-like peptidoglycan-associated protein
MKTKTGFALLKVCATVITLGLAMQLTGCAGQDMSMKDKSIPPTTAQSAQGKTEASQQHKENTKSQAESKPQQTAATKSGDNPPQSGSKTQQTAQAGTETAESSLKEPTIGREEKARVELDDLATSLAKYRDVFRIGESVIVPLPDSHLFRANNSSIVSNKGATLLSQISESLRKYPDTRVYIQEYVPAGNTKVQSREQAMDQAYILRSELINRLIPPNRLVVDISQRQSAQGNNAPPDTGALEHRFDLHIIPLDQ